jgi:hypothetical protein
MSGSAKKRKFIIPFGLAFEHRPTFFIKRRRLSNMAQGGKLNLELLPVN